MTARDQQKLRFAVFELDVTAQELRKGGTRVHLEIQPFQVLLTLLQRPGEIITREELKETLWAGDTFVDFDAGVNRAISKIRAALGDSALRPRFVETLPRRGYRFIGRLEPTEPNTGALDSPIHRRYWLGYAGTGLVGILGGVPLYHFVTAAFGTSESAGPIRRFAIQPPERMRVSHQRKDVSISPDGRYIAFFGGEKGQLRVHDLQEGETRAVEGAQGINSPFWSPNSEFLVFATDDELRRVPLHGGPATRICKIGRDLVGGAVSPDSSTIVFCRAAPAELFVVPFDGGEARPLHSKEEREKLSARLDVRMMSHAPQFLPRTAGGPILLFSVGFANTRKVVQNLSTGWFKDLGPGSFPVYSPTGHILYRQGVDLWAVPFSISELDLKGEPFLVRQNAISPSVAADGTLVYLDYLPPQMQLTIRDREGRRSGTVGEPGPIAPDPIRISLDGAWVAYPKREAGSDRILLHDLRKGIEDAVTLDGATCYSPAWSPDGQSIAFTSNRDGGYDIFLKDPKRTEEPKKISGNTDREVVSDWSPSGRYILYRRNRPDTGADLWYLERTPEGEWTSRPFLETQSYENWGRFSPNGRYVAYVSDESGQPEIYVCDFPRGESKVRISKNGGTSPRWSSDGSELFYVEETTVVSLPVSTTSEFVPGHPASLFPLSGSGAWDVFPDGKRFLIVERVGPPPAPNIHVVLNWHEEFAERVNT